MGMAAREHSYTRRAVLGAAVAVPVAAGAGGGSSSVRPSPPAASRRVPLPQRAGEANWERNLADYRRAEAELIRFGRATGERAEELTYLIAWSVEKRFNDRVVLVCRGLRRLLKTPAPDLEALALKIELIVDQDVASLSGGPSCMAVLKADARRLAMRKG